MNYIMSDIHGDRDRFRSVMNQIHITDGDHLYVLGDVIDRYPYGIEILLELMGMENVTVLLGNHELMMLEALNERDYTSAKNLWYRNGGKFTHVGFISKPAKTKQRILDYLASLPLTAEVVIGEKQYLLSHGAPPELQGIIPSKYTDPRKFAVWTRLQEDDPVPGGKTIVFGHTPTSYYQDEIPLRIWHGAGKIGIDCGSGQSHPNCRLACLRLEDMKEYYSE